MPKTKYPYIPFRPTPEQDARLRKLAKRLGVSVAELVRNCIDAHLPRIEQAV